MKLTQLLNGIEYEVLNGSTDLEISDVIYNTKRIAKNTAFVCIKGAKFDSHTIAQEAVDGGAIAVVVEHEVEVENVTVIKVKDTRIALALMAANLYDHPANKLTTIAVTGSKGKTTTTFMIKEILEKAGNKTGLIGSIGVFSGDKELDPRGHNTTPEGYEIHRLFDEMVKDGCKYVVMETSSQGFKLNRTAGLVFDYGIFLNISRDHISPWEHATLEEYLECKAQLMKQCKVGVVNFDDEKLDQILAGHTCEVRSFGFNEGADILVTDYKTISKPKYMGVEYTTKGLMNLTVDVGSPGKFSIYDSVAAAYVCKCCGVKDEIITKALEEIEIRGRVEKVKIDAPYTVVLDFAHNGIGVKNLITAIKEYKPNRIIAVFGSDGNRTKIRRADAGEILGNMADLTILTSNCPRFEKVEDINNEIKVGLDRTDGEYIEINDRRSAIKHAMSIAQEGDFILLIGKGHWDYEEINGVMYPFDERVVVKELYEELKKAD
ncbi:MAG: UDP-N-acetylmuramoyl-L-alanyl-D-glutamate--2,6-diaminopimelate ligase [Clostridiales bacterium]|nr:UDP-N-acetylmuramoyl-L-alanyl-D-glutamate--2,6-diaminopimelate ligase [Clostridiales bacterium]